MTETAPTPYKERDDWVPNPLYVTGHIDTTGTSGDAPADISTISPVFAEARAMAVQAATALAEPAAEEQPAEPEEELAEPEEEPEAEDTV